MLPNDSAFVEMIAKSIARSRARRDAAIVFQQITGLALEHIETLVPEDTIDSIFEKVWNGTSQHDQEEKNGYIQDARAAISAINLSLLTTAT